MKPFNDSYAPIENVQTVHVAFALDTDEGETCIIRLNNALNFRQSMENSILCTNQARHNGVIIDDIPHLVDINKTSTQSVYFLTEDKRFSLLMNGPVSHLNV